MHCGGCKTCRTPQPRGDRVTKFMASRMALESPGTAGETPVGESYAPLRMFLSTTGHANPVGIREAHLPRLNTLDDR